MAVTRPCGFVSRVEADLARRDFTINAMAYDPEEGLVDPFDGRGDLARGLVRAVGQPGRRFEEDGLRILRLYRFGARFGFRLEDETRRAAQNLCGRLGCVSVERIEAELTGLLAAPRPGAWLEPAVMAVILPELEPKHSRNGLQHSVRRWTVCRPALGRWCGWRCCCLLWGGSCPPGAAAAALLKGTDRPGQPFGVRQGLTAEPAGAQRQIQARRLLGRLVWRPSANCCGWQKPSILGRSGRWRAGSRGAVRTAKRCVLPCRSAGCQWKRSAGSGRSARPGGGPHIAGAAGAG